MLPCGTPAEQLSDVVSSGRSQEIAIALVISRRLSARDLEGSTCFEARGRGFETPRSDQHLAGKPEHRRNGWRNDWATLRANTQDLVRHDSGECTCCPISFGAANRADIRRLRDLEIKNVALKENVSRRHKQLRGVVISRDATRVGKAR